MNFSNGVRGVRMAKNQPRRVYSDGRTRTIRRHVIITYSSTFPFTVSSRSTDSSASYFRVLKLCVLA